MGQRNREKTMKEQLTEKDFEWAASELGCEVATIKAVDSVESRGKGFYESGEPVILYEAHIFSRLTDRKYDKSHPDISSRTWNRNLYGSSSGAHQHGRLQKAVELDRDAALQSSSWGRFQLMGFNWKACGFSSLQSFINSMYRSERGQLEGFVGFLKSQNLARHLVNKNWAAFARGYNGPGYAQNKYDTKLAQAYARFR